MPAARTVDVQTFLNEHPFSRFQWVIFGLCFWVVLLALLWQIWLKAACEQHLAVRAS
jgi:hypothetical protein